METWLGEEQECAMDGGMSVCERRTVTFVLVGGWGRGDNIWSTQCVCLMLHGGQTVRGCNKQPVLLIY